MSELETPYRPQEIETKWQQRWANAGTFAASERSEAPKYYVLEMFPYPSGKLHMGHVRNYSIGDVIARFKRARGFDILHPMGWDAFGLPAEQAAIKHGTHPAKWTWDNISAMREQLKRMGFGYDWDREIATCHPDYYRWEQMLFLQMLSRGLAYKKSALVNWSPTSGVLANEQVVDGKDWRTGEPVQQKEMEQWYLRITDYAQELLDSLKDLDGWPQAVKAQQEAWIGRSEGAAILFAIEGVEDLEGVEGPLEVFTTRPDTLYGCTYMSLAPEHPWTRRLAQGTEQEADVRAFVDRMGLADRAERTDEKAEKLGVFVGRYAINPVNGRRIPIYTANFVLADYGTGAVMAVPAHDQRDFEFATKYGLDKVVVIQPEEGPTLNGRTLEAAWTGGGRLVASGQHDGLDDEEGKKSIVEELHALGCGRATINFRLRDWGISRQRYWGCPVPIVYCDACGMVPVPQDQLPVVLPETVDMAPQGPGSPLDYHEDFVKTSCPNCGGAAQRETDTFDTFMESSWYFLRYCSPRFDGGMVERSQADRLMPVDQYIGGIEHAVMHLLYARFYTKVLRDLGVVAPDLNEPFKRLLCQGMVTHETYKLDGAWVHPEEAKAAISAGRSVEVGRVEKMSKSKKNTVDPQALIDHYGADTCRLFSLFAAPPERDLEWTTSGVEGAARFLRRIWRLASRRMEDLRGVEAPRSLDGRAGALRRTTHRTIQRVTNDIEKRFQLNTAIAAIMELNNAASALESEQGKGRELDAAEKSALGEAIGVILQLLAPFAPHFANELWEQMGHEDWLETRPWPEADPAIAAAQTMTLVVQVKGKKRGELEVPVDAPEGEITAAALALPNVQKFVGEAPPRLVKYIPGRLVTIVPG